MSWEIFSKQRKPRKRKWKKVLKRKNLTLNEFRIKNQMSYRDLSILTGCAQGSIWNWCHGVSKPHPALQNQITAKTDGVVTSF